MPTEALDPVPIGLAFASAFVLTPAVGAFARRIGMIARPKSDRWHTRPTALLGGLAIFAAVAVGDGIIGFGMRADWAIAGGAACAFAMGLIDDLFHIGPLQKLFGQLIAAVLVVSLGVIVPASGLFPIDAAITLFWLVGITNALNLIDNMDGLAGGVTAIAAVFLSVHFLQHGDANHATRLAVLASAASGFLFFNSKPASIFMGDCGALFLGFALAGSSILWLRTDTNPPDWQNLLVPPLILAVPIFDTTLVSIVRKRAGRAIAQGGRDHTSHRLVARGLSERGAVGALYAISIGCGVLSLFLPRTATLGACAIAFACGLAFAVLGIYLARTSLDE